MLGCKHLRPKNIKPFGIIGKKLSQSLEGDWKYFSEFLKAQKNKRNVVEM